MVGKSLGLIPQAGLEALHEDLDRVGDWYGIALDNAAGAGRVLVQRISCGGYIQNAEILRAADGRGWVIYADSQCPTCEREVRVSRRLGFEVDLVTAVNEVALELGRPPLSVAQHAATCEQSRTEAW